MSLKRKMSSLIMVGIGGAATFAGINMYKGNPQFYKQFLMPAVHLLDPETAHNLAVFTNKYRLFPKSGFIDPDILKTNLFGQQFSNPIGIAAGYDKHGEAVLGLSDIGFGFIEIGSVTPQPQLGNDKPRVFRLEEDLAVINRYGFNSDGHDKVYNRLEKIRKQNYKVILGINLGKNKESPNAIQDYVKGIEKFADVADYFVINISSPNTPGLRNMQTKSALTDLLRSVIETRNKLRNKKPILLKLAPELSYGERKDVANVISKLECKIDGLIICNTTTSRPDCLTNTNKDQIGGLSGEPVRDISTKMIADMYKLTNGVPIIGVGGISSGIDAYEKIKAGASMVQIYTSLVYEGPPVVTKIKMELVDLLIADNHKNISEAVGKNVK